MKRERSRDEDDRESDEDRSPQRRSRSIRNVFCTDQKVHNEYNYQFRDGGFAVPPHESTIINYQPGPSSLMTMETLNYPYLGSDYNLTTASSHDNIHQQSLSFCNNLSILQYEIDFQGIDARKRPIEEEDRGSNSNVVGREWTTNKKKAVCLQEQWHHQLKEELKEIQRDRVPVRRSQKLSDKITALQKLVSPYGKTDTASVLQEASISIKVLQDQIQNLFRMLSASYTSSKPLDLQKFGENQLDLRSRGLCLVPLSFTQNFTKQDQV